MNNWDGAAFDLWLTREPAEAPECPTCEGVGTIDQARGSWAIAVIPCPDCGGNGFIDLADIAEIEASDQADRQLDAIKDEEAWL